MLRGIFCANGMENFFQRDGKSFRTGSRKKDTFVRLIRFVHFVVEKGLVELEDLRDAGIRIISINDSIDYPTYDDWTTIQFRFLINEMPVTDAYKEGMMVLYLMGY